MMEKITVNLTGEGVITTEKGISLLALGKQYSHLTKRPILMAKVNNELQDLCALLYFDCAVEFLDITNTNAFRAYQRSVSLLMIYAAKTVLGIKTRVVIAHSVNKNFYCELPDLQEPITDGLLSKMEAVMKEAAEKDFPIERHSLPRGVASRIADDMGMADKVNLLKYRRTSSVNFYKMDWMYDYFYGQMIPSTGYLDTFKLVKKSRGFILQMPSPKHNYEITELEPNKKVLDVFAESNSWARILKVDTVCSLNDRLCQSGGGEIIREAEALHEKKIAYLADQIMQQKKTIVLIAGPSSSGKTTFATRLSIQLRVNGMRPYVISLDDYYLNREDVPRDEKGNYDFETIDAIDTQQIDRDLRGLTNGETVALPHFNFLTGVREYKGRNMRLTPGDVLIIEGIHGLNERVSESIPRSDKFKIFISALTQLNIDDHNRIPTTDTRLVRRIVRDHQYRGHSAIRTIDMWPSVMRGESMYIFPFQEEADAFFNSALIYEMCVLKQYAEPLLFGVDEKLPAFTEAKRLVKFLDCFLGVPSEHVPPNSILREFVGGSCF
jgi:uridine kinase